MLSRRLFMGGTAAALGLVACQGGLPSETVEVGARKLKKIGLQTYTLREIFEDDPVGTLKMIKEIGYDYVELNGRNFSERSAKDMIGMVKDAGLYCPATHYSLEGVRDDFAKTVRDAQDLGVDYMIVPWIGEESRSVEGYKSIAAMFNERGRQARDEGFKLAYHNHQFEFFDLGGGVNGMDILLNETDPDMVDFELDLFWAKLELDDIPSFMRAHPGRFKLAHVKDMKGDPAKWKNSVDFDAIKADLMVNVGEGDMPFESYFALNDISGMEYFIMEHDNPPKPFRRSVKQSIDAARAMRF
jgi:sugar phosphate isomerase/epimerase